MALNEKKWWSSHVKPKWTNLEQGRMANKVQDAFNSGLPDVDLICKGVVAKVELKYATQWPARPDTKLTFSKDKTTGKYCVASPAQMMQLKLWDRCHGLAYVMIGIGKEWFLCPVMAIEPFNWGITQAELRAAAILSGESYQDLVKVPEYLEATYLYGG
jgi:hypothetical protein